MMVMIVIKKVDVGPGGTDDLAKLDARKDGPGNRISGLFYEVGRTWKRTGLHVTFAIISVSKLSNQIQIMMLVRIFL